MRNKLASKMGLLLLGLALIKYDSASAGLYHVTDLGTLGGVDAGGFPSTDVSAINNKNQIVGDSWTINQTKHAFLYDNGTMKDLGTLGGSGSSASAINDNGQIVGGSSNVGNTTGLAFLYSNGSMQSLGMLPGGTSSKAYAINNLGQIAGSWRTASGQVHAFLYANGSFTDLGTPPSTNRSDGFGINDSGVVVGPASSLTELRSFSYSNGTMTDLLPSLLSAAAGINDAGQIVGYASSTTFTGYSAYLYDHGVLNYLGRLPGDSTSQALGVNSAGVVVGTSGNVIGEDFGTGLRAFIYRDGKLSDLNTLLDASGAGWLLQSAKAINDNGWIVGVGVNPQGQVQSFLLTPVPEPGTLVLALLAIAGFVAFARRSHSG